MGIKRFASFGGNGCGSSLTQLNNPSSILLVENEGKLLISDYFKQSSVVRDNWNKKSFDNKITGNDDHQI